MSCNCQNNCGCEPTNLFIGPGQCCPDVSSQLHSIIGVDRNCNPVRLEPEDNTIVGSDNGRVKNLDGSDEKPIKLAVAKRISGSGGILIQGLDGRIIAVIPDIENIPDVSYLTYSGGVFKFAGIDQILNFSDEEMPSVTGGFLASFGCSGDGRLSLAKFIPGCSGRRFLVINEDGTVSCDEVSVTECRDLETTGISDGILVCHSGTQKLLTPEEGKTIVGVADGDDVTWQLTDAITGHTFVTQHTVHSRVGSDMAVTTAPFTTNVDVTTLPGYDASYTGAILSGWLETTIRTANYKIRVKIDGRQMLSAFAHATYAESSDNNQMHIPIPENKVWVLSQERSLWLAGDNYGSYELYIWLDGWFK